MSAMDIRFPEPMPYEPTRFMMSLAARVATVDPPGRGRRWEKDRNGTGMPTWISPGGQLALSLYPIKFETGFMINAAWCGNPQLAPVVFKHVRKPLKQILSLDLFRAGYMEDPVGAGPLRNEASLPALLDDWLCETL